MKKRNNKYNKTQKQKDTKFNKVMDEFGSGILRSSSGEIVTDRDQAFAIAFSESGLKNNKGLSNKHLAANMKYNEHFNIHRMPFFNKPQKTPEGFLIIDTVIAEIGVLPYTYIDHDGKEFIQNELLDQAIFSREHINSCDGAPFVLEHPMSDGMLVDVTPENYKDVVKGVLINPRIDIPTGKLIGTLKVWDDETIEKIESKELSEISGGYRCRVIPESGNFEGQPFEARQTNMLMNHLALVEEGRAGDSVRVLFNSKNRSTKMKKTNQKEPDEKDNTGTPPAEPPVKPDEVMPANTGHKDEIAGSRGAFNQGDAMEMMVKMMAELMKMFGGQAVNAGDPVQPQEVPQIVEGAGAPPRVEDVKKQVLNSFIADNMRNMVLEQMNDVQETYAKAKAILGSDLPIIASKFNTLDGFRRNMLVQHANMNEEAVKKMNAFEIQARYDVYTEHAKEQILNPRHNQQDYDSESISMSIADFVNA